MNERIVLEDNFFRNLFILCPILVKGVMLFLLTLHG